MVAAIAMTILVAVDTASAQVQPELTKFVPLTQEDLVDHFTGDLRYTVQILEVPGPNGGYPIVLSYASGITPEQDASWVGLGWTLSPGAIVRQLRGIPDDFDGGSKDVIQTTHDIEPNVTYGLGLAGNYEFFGVDTSVGTGLTAGLTGFFDNYRGFGITHTVGLSAQVKKGGVSAGLGLNLSENNLEGARVGATGSLSLGDNFTFGADTAFDPSRGLSALSLNAQARYQSASFLVSSGNLVTYLGYAKPAALPRTPREMQGSNIKVSFKAGGEVYGNYISGMMFGYYNSERVRSRTVSTKAYGFLYLDHADNTAAVDFNRERDGALYAQSPNLAMPVMTHDLYVATGRDVVGTFRAYRNDAPVVFDPQQKSDMTGGAIGVDVGFGNVLKVGVTGALNTSSTVVQRWGGAGGDALLKSLQDAFVDDPSGIRERTYFKFIGEPSFAQASIVKGDQASPIAPTLQENFDGSQMPPWIYTAGLPNGALQQAKTERTPRATLIQAFTNGELRTMANALPDVARDAAPLLSDPIRAANHIGAFRITTTSGARYVYGTAVYNTKYEEHKFTVDRKNCPAGPDPCTIVSPPQGATGYDYQASGSEKMLEIRSLAPYPTSYLLTAVLGPDYIDADDVPGPSDGDYGYWVKFNYVRDQDAQGGRPFKWRVPFVGASFVRGPDNGRYVAGTERSSDVGSVTYGERESWYLASIETATHKAFLCVSRSDRRDAIGAGGLMQNAPPTAGFAIPWRLTGIKLFSKAALAGVPDPSTNCPADTALVESRFEYDNSLMKDAPNATSGKLTLKKVYSTHLDSKRGRLSPYEFEYEDPASAGNGNPSYADANHDRWNTYRDAKEACGTPPIPGTAPPLVPGEDNPATCQDKQTIDPWASAWTLRRIVEPSGRVLKVDYESDDYAFVQDQPAARLFRVMSVNAAMTTPTPPSAARICPVRSNGGTPICATNLNRNGNAAERPRVYFKLDAPCALGTDAACSAWVADHYLEPSRQLYFKIRVALKNGADPDPPGARAGSAGKWQMISGYAHALDAGIAAGTADLGWIELEPVHSNYPTGIDYHPFAHAAWQYLRLQQPELIHTGGINGDPAGNPFDEAVRVLTLVDVIPDLIEMFSGVYPTWAGNGWGQFVDLEHSWIRLRDPDGIKLGGGARVRQVTFSDGWNASTAGQESDLETGFVYSYRLEDGRSSGVASYEPVVGGQENPLRRPKPFTDEVLLSSNYNLFTELPIGESHYPAPTVGYSRVVRTSLAAHRDVETRRQNNDCATPGQNSRPRPTSVGPTVYEFYTARDFPVRSAESPILKRRPPVPEVALIPLLGEITMSVVTAAQGYSTVLNDMHGKPQRVTSYEYTANLDCSHPEDLDYIVRNDPVKETTFNYRSSGGVGDSPFALANAGVPTLVDDPKPEPKVVAEQTDFVVDLRQNKTESFDGGVNLNVDTFLVAYIPIPIPVPMPNFGYSLTETKTVVTSRVVHEAGLLESVTVREGSARVTTRTTEQDPLTGATLLSDSDNAYGGSIYSYNMPARWTYARMGAGYEDVGRKFNLTGATIAPGGRQLTTSTPVAICAEQPPQQNPNCLPLGTELAAPSETGGARLTLLSGDANGTTFAIDGDAGAPLANAVVVRSGNRNMLTSSTDSIRALDNPLGKRDPLTCIRSDRTIDQTRLSNVLDASHTTFLDVWDIAADVRLAGAPGNPYARGLRGIFRPSKQYVYLAERGRSSPIDLSRDGTFDLLLFGKGDDPAACEGWLQQLINNRYSASGFVTEKRNAIGVPSASLFGSRGSLLFAVAGNARADEVGFEGFETSVKSPQPQYQANEGNISFNESGQCLLCTPTGQGVSLSSTWAHTGRRSLLITQDAKFDQPRLKLEDGKTYLISAWVSLGRPNTPLTDVPTFASKSNTRNLVGLRISYRPALTAASSVLATLAPDGPIIDGWQRVEGTFVAPQGGRPVTLEFLAGNSGGATPRPVYFDDLRIQPDDGTLQAFVYDGNTLRLTATLDENNFATFYRYTPEGQLDLIRRETVRGVFAVEEGRLHTRERP
jgi:hypothetical protein